MATDTSDVVKQGYVRVRSKNLGIWQKRWLILRRASSKGPSRIEKYPDEKGARTAPTTHKTALLINVLTITRLPISTKKHSFTVNFNTGDSKWFASDSGN